MTIETEWHQSKHLAAAVLWDAYQSLRNLSHHNGASVGLVAMRHTREVAWVMKNDGRDPWSFVRICELLDLCPDAVRDQWRSEGVLDKLPEHLDQRATRGNKARYVHRPKVAA